MSSAGLDGDEMLDVSWVRSQFPSLETRVNGRLMGRPQRFLRFDQYTLTWHQEDAVHSRTTFRGSLSFLRETNLM
jgi:hypothetical protein